MECKQASINHIQHSKPIICKTGTYYLQPGSISVIMVQTPIELDTQHIYDLNASNDLPLGVIFLVVDDKIDHKYPKSLRIPILKTPYDRVYISRATVTSILNPSETKSTKVSNISWTKIEKSQDSITNSSTELPTIPPESSFQPEHNESKR